MILAEGKQISDALRALPDPRTAGLTPTNLADMAYVYRLAKQPEMALALVNRALDLAPENRWAWREKVFSLSALGSAFKAEQAARNHWDWFSRPEQQQLKASVATQSTRDAYQERKRLDRAHRYAELNLPLKNALQLLEINRAEFADNPRLELTTRYDQIYVSRELRLWKQAIAEFESLPQHPRTASEDTLRNIPDYVRTAAAEAYDADQQPKEAVRLLESVVQQYPGSDVDVFISLYYAYLDAEQYDKGEALLTKIQRVTPIWVHGSVNDPNWERMGVEQT